MKKLLLFSILPLIFILTLFISPKTAFADAMSDCLARGNNQQYCNVYVPCVNGGGTAQSCQVKACVAQGNTPTECYAGAGVYNTSPWYVPNQTNFQSEVKQGLSNANFASVTTSNVANTLGYLIAGDTTPSNNSQTNRGAIGLFASSINMMVQTRPASSIDYIAYEINNLRVPGSPQPAYAATGGIGFNSLTPVLQIWTVARNLAYLIFAIIFIIIGIMIMTRQKIDPKTVASIQNALPKIIFALILVTFSYAIAGFLIDLMFVLLALIVTLCSSVTSQGSSINFGQKATDLLSYNIFKFALSGDLWTNGLTTVSAAIQNIVVSFLGQNNSNIPGAAGAGTFIGFAFGALAYLIVAIAILVALFRTWLSLLGAYANIILSIISSPILLMMDAIPGQNQFTNWLKSMLANLLAFPLVTIFLMIGYMLTTNFGKGVPGDPNTPASGFVPPLIGGNNQLALQSLIGVGIILTIPKALNILQEALKAPAFKYGNAWMESATIGGRTTMGAGSRTARYGINEGLGWYGDKYRVAEKQRLEDEIKPGASPGSSTAPRYTWRDAEWWANKAHATRNKSS